ncbi:hypothetical protein CC2G_013532 [Coprinopsis cinerea AmutBmut pab1-1]|nr:hypothetical protein CC2G_013532 [Coprinopsis cinerea AmutBmut pab1-1]
MPTKAPTYSNVSFSGSMAKIRGEDGANERHSIYINNNTGQKLLQCPKCRVYLKYNPKTPQSFVSHRGSSTCNRYLRSRVKMETKKEEEQALADVGFASAPDVEDSSSTRGLTSEPSFASSSTFEISLPPSSPPPPVDDSDDDEYTGVGITFAPINRSDGPGVLLLVDDAHYSSDGTEDSLHDDQDDYSEMEEELSNPCGGQPIKWVVGSIWETFCYQQHADERLSWKPIGYLSDNRILLRSKDCKRALGTEKERQSKRCSACTALQYSASVARCQKRAQKASPHTPYKYLTSSQLMAALQSATARANTLRSSNTSLRRQLMRLKVKVNKWQSIAMKVAYNDIPGASRVLEVGLAHGDSADTILRRLDEVCLGIYRPHGRWTERELDIAFLVKALGGPLLLYALQRAQHFPSVSTLRSHKRIPELLVSVDTPTKDEIYNNISEFLGDPKRKPSNPEIGLNLMVDGVALEEVPRYDHGRNAILGLCHEHSSGQKKTFDDVSDLDTLKEGLDCNKWHRSKDGIVFAVAPVTAEENYNPIPLLLVGSCKSETGESVKQLLNDFITVFNAHPSGRSKWGNIFELSTDGEASFRGSRFGTCMSEFVKASPEATVILEKLKGMNCFTGPDGRIGTCDPKHIFKRLATMIRSYTIIQLFDSSISHSDVRMTLKAAGIPKEKIDRLLSPVDKQNVPIAVNLIEELARVELEPLSKQLNPSQFLRARRVRFFAKVCLFFVAPFTDVHMSLAEQIRSLSTYVHLTFALYSKGKGSFMGGALYGDSMSIVKCIILELVRLQSIDPNIKFYIFFIGTDRLEGIFSHVRTQDHSRNVDILQLSHKVSIGSEINTIFERHPDLYRGHTRRKLENVDGVDHVNPVSWKGDVTVGNVDLPVEYECGREDAVALLKSELGVSFDFDEAFAKENVDLLRPFGTYVGSRAADGQEATADGESGIVDEDDEEEANSHSISTAIPPSDTPANNTQPHTSTTPELAYPTPPSDAESEGIELEQLNPPCDGITTTPSAPDDPRFVRVNGKLYYKSSMVAQCLVSDSARKVTIRPFRAAGMTMKYLVKRAAGDSTIGDLDSPNPTDGLMVRSKDLGGILVRCGNVVCLAVLEVIHFKQGTDSKHIFEIEAKALEEKSIQKAGCGPKAMLPSQTKRRL